MASNKTRNSGTTNPVIRGNLTVPVPPLQPEDDQQDDTDQSSRQGQGGTPPRDPEQLLEWFKTATQADADAWLQSVKSEVVDDRQQNDDISRFFNQIGWAERTPEVLDENTFQQVYQAAGKPQMMYHSDDPIGTKGQPGYIGGREFISQYMGNSKDAAGNTRRQYYSNGIYGNGTYYATTAGESAYYGKSQFHGFLNSNAKTISISSLNAKINAYCNKYPAFKSVYDKITGGYSGSDTNDSQASVSVMAAMMGYNVIHNGHGYYAVLDRSVTTVSSLTKKASTSMRDW